MGKLKGSHYAFLDEVKKLGKEREEQFKNCPYSIVCQHILIAKPFSVAARRLKSTPANVSTPDGRVVKYDGDIVACENCAFLFDKLSIRTKDGFQAIHMIPSVKRKVELAIKSIKDY